jgi:rubrerythrin
MQSTTEYLIAKMVQFNNKAESQAIEDYTDFLKLVAESELDEDFKNYIASVINEIIADELNHQEKLQEMFTALTNVEPNKE